MKSLMAAATLLSLLAMQADAQRGSLAQRIAAYADSGSARWIAIRRDLHQNPEVSGQEERTAKIVADWLRTSGWGSRPH